MNKPKRRKFRQETVIHSFVTRPLSIEIIRLIWNTKITANQITIFRIILNLIALFLFLKATFISIIVGFIIFHINELLDATDGLYARLKNQTSKLGYFMEIFFDTIFSTSYGVFGFIIAYSGYSLSNDLIYIYLFFVLSQGFMLNLLFKQSFKSKNKNTEQKDPCEYIPILGVNIQTSLKNILKTIYIWQNEVLLFGILLYLPLLKYGIDTLLIAFLFIAILNNLVWIEYVLKYYRDLKNENN